MCAGWNTDVRWDAAVLRQLLLSRTDWQHSNTTSDSVWWHVADSSVGVNDALNQHIHYAVVVILSFLHLDHEECVECVRIAFVTMASHLLPVIVLWSKIWSHLLATRLGL